MHTARSILRSAGILLLAMVCATAGLSAEKKTLVLEPLRITLDDTTGVFTLSIVDGETGEWVSLLEPSEHGTTSGFYVRNSGSVRKLAVGTGVAVETMVDETSATLSYTVSGNYVVDIRFEPFKTKDKKTYDNVRVDLAIQNISNRPQVISVKAVFDTWLGEQTDTHFTTANEQVINTERKFENLGKTQFIRSSGQNNTIQFLFAGADISVPDGVYVANRDVLLQESWTPKIREDRIFDSIETYNNSAVGVNWHQVSLSPQTRSNLCFYITTATSSGKPGTVRSLGLEETSRITAADSDLPTYTDSYGTTYTMGAITQEQLDPVYINELLDRIKELEKDSDNATRDEIRKLNAELDAIFAKLGRSAG